MIVTVDGDIDCPIGEHHDKEDKCSHDIHVQYEDPNEYTRRNLIHGTPERCEPTYNSSKVMDTLQQNESQMYITSIEKVKSSRNCKSDCTNEVPDPTMMFSDDCPPLEEDCSPAGHLQSIKQ